MQAFPSLNIFLKVKVWQKLLRPRLKLKNYNYDKNVTKIGLVNVYNKWITFSYLFGFVSAGFLLIYTISIEKDWEVFPTAIERTSRRQKLNEREGK